MSEKEPGIEEVKRKDESAAKDEIKNEREKETKKEDKITKDIRLKKGTDEESVPRKLIPGIPILDEDGEEKVTAEEGVTSQETAKSTEQNGFKEGKVASEKE